MSASHYCSRILVIGGCTPVGCVLIQILKHWNSHITATCTRRAIPVAKALGANDIINYECQSLNNEDHEATFYNELESREMFDFIVVTKKSTLNLQKLTLFCNGRVISTIQQKRPSDSCNIFQRLMIGTWIYTKFWLEVNSIES